MPLPFLAFDLQLQKPLEYTCGEFLRRLLAIERILSKLRQVTPPPVEFALFMSRRFVIKLAIVTGEAELLYQAELGKQFRMIEDNVGEDFFVKQIQAPRPEPD